MPQNVPFIFSDIADFAITNMSITELVIYHSEMLDSSD